jgi:two-component system, chemotaxis family, protein-glutamate methylesterase/glutaminase
VHVVALVSSAGGLLATRDVLEGLPADFPGCVLVLQHTSPDRESSLGPIIQRRTALRVLDAEEGGPLAAGHVFVAPSGCHTLITPDRRTSLIISGRYPPARPSADLLLTTLAMAVGPLAIAVVMSGTGHDAATGATAIHRRGGVVLTTDEETSAHFSMPAAAIERDDIVDAIVPVPELPPRLLELVTTPVLGGPADPA